MSSLLSHVLFMLAMHSGKMYMAPSFLLWSIAEMLHTPTLTTHWKNANIFWLKHFILQCTLNKESTFQNYLAQNDCPRANGAKRRSRHKPGGRVTNSALAFTYIRIMRCYIAQWHSGIKSRPIFWIWMLDRFRCFVHA